MIYEDPGNIDESVIKRMNEVREIHQNTMPMPDIQYNEMNFSDNRRKTTDWDNQAEIVNVDSVLDTEFELSKSQIIIENHKKPLSQNDIKNPQIDVLESLNQYFLFLFFVCKYFSFAKLKANH